MDMYPLCCIIAVLAAYFSRICAGCQVAILADDAFVAYVDGQQVASSTNFAQQELINLTSSGAQILAIDATNNNGASGVLVMTSPQFKFYSYGGAADWRCRSASGVDNSDLSWTTPEFDDSAWPTAYTISTYRSDTSPWSNFRHSYDVIDVRAEWIWTDNPGREGQSELGTDTHIHCRAAVPTSCTSYEEPVYEPDDCAGNGGRLVDSRYCIQYVPGAWSWSEARDDALMHGGVLAALLSERHQAAATELLQESGAPQAWIGATANLQLNTKAWHWIAPCCDVTGEEITELFDQGCYSESLADREFDYAVNLTGLADLQPSVCAQQCQQAGYEFAALQGGSECYCADTFGSRGAIDTCSLTCPATGEFGCGGLEANRVYRVDGAFSPWYLPNEPDNDQAGQNSDDDYEFCATLALFRRDVTDAAYTDLGLIDRLCREEHRFVCEVPVDSSLHCDRVFIHDGVTRCIHLNDSIQLSWFQARQFCQSLNGDLITLQSEAMYDDVMAHMNDTALEILQVWVGLTKHSWVWQDAGEDVTQFNAFAPGEPRDQQRECVTLDAEADFTWTTQSCDEQTVYLKRGYLIMTEIVQTTTDTPVMTTADTSPARTTDVVPMTTSETALDVAPSTVVPVHTTEVDFSTVVQFNSFQTTAPADMTFLPDAAVTSDITTDNSMTTMSSVVTGGVDTSLSHQAVTRATTTRQSNTMTSFPPPDDAVISTETASNASLPEITTTTTSTSTSSTTTESPVTPPGAGQPAASRNNNSSNDDDVSSTQIAIIVVVLCVVLAVVALVIGVWCYKKKYTRVAPDRGQKYDARAQAELAYGGNLGENTGSLFTISSEAGSTAGLLEHSEVQYNMYSSARSLHDNAVTSTSGPAASSSRILVD